MKYEVIYHSRAERAIREAFAYIEERSPLNAERWLRRLYKAVKTLEEMPARCGRAIENKDVDVELRQLLFQSHRIIFTIRDQQVHVLTIRHAARRPVPPEHLRP